ncbi:MAG: AlpA family phage regulatory protein [Rhodoferax sp.]|uniref:helix-turn-helix transcriptional regulator n=1 Tax=Rhodoferax sp. TaxID=50421 RepID=UPI0026384B04|nr:AlpA family phage regulatory protein [Rhodoferax sp.]MDD2882842.1 AlpA family phage regulatory protein [Rhodoferax sp.]
MKVTLKKASYMLRRNPAVTPPNQSLGGQTTIEAIVTERNMAFGAKVLADPFDCAQSEQCATYGGPVILRIGPVQLRIGLSRSFIYSMLDPESPSHDPTFPKPIRLSARAVGWVESEISAWLTSRIAASRRITNRSF